MENMICKFKEHVKFWIEMAEEHYDRKFEMLPIDLKLRGRCAGQFTYKQIDRFGDWVKEKKLRFNLDLYRHNEKEFHDHTIPHEVAHYIQHEVYGYGKNIKPHGKEWKYVMQTVLGVKATRCHSMDISVSKTRKTFDYKCGCQTYQLTSIRHNKIRKGTTYSCKKCRQQLKLV
jgi:SprT protein